MKYRIIGTTIPAVEIKFDAPGETMYTQSGGMSWMSEGISMSTNTRGGFMKGLGRMFAGESMFMATYRADAPGATIAFASTVPGQVLPIDAAENGGMICQKGAFLCAQDSVNLDVLPDCLAAKASSLNPSPVPEWPFSKSTAMLSRNSLHRAK